MERKVEMKNDVIVALDIGTLYLKLLIRENGRIKKMELARRPVEENNLFFLLQEWVGKYNLKRKPCFYSISGPEVNIQYFSFPPLSSEELSSAIRVEAEQILDKDLAKMDSDFYLLNKDKKGEKVLFVASPRLLNDEKALFVRRVGMKPTGLNLQSIALANGYLAANKNSPITLLLNIGHRITNLAIVEKEKLLFIRDIAWGGEELVREIVKKSTFQMPAVINLLAKGEEFAGINFSEIVEKVVPAFLGEIVKTLDYCEQHDKIKVKNLVVTGGGSQTPQLTEFLSRKLALNLENWLPLEKLNFMNEEKKKLTPFCGIVLGLSLQNYD